jgi:hypothetical protein
MFGPFFFRNRPPLPYLRWSIYRDVQGGGSNPRRHGSVHFLFSVRDREPLQAMLICFRLVGTSSNHRNYHRWRNNRFIFSDVPMNERRVSLTGCKTNECFTRRHKRMFDLLRLDSLQFNSLAWSTRHGLVRKMSLKLESTWRIVLSSYTNPEPEGSATMLKMYRQTRNTGLCRRPSFWCVVA